MLKAIKLPRKSKSNKSPIFFLVQPRIAPGSNPAPDNLLRLSLPLLEEKILSNQKCLKNVIRLLKVKKNTFLLAKKTLNVNFLLSFIHTDMKVHNMTQSFIIIIMCISLLV